MLEIASIKLERDQAGVYHASAVYPGDAAVTNADPYDCVRSLMDQMEEDGALAVFTATTAQGGD